MENIISKIHSGMTEDTAKNLREDFLNEMKKLRGKISLDIEKE